LRRYALIPPFTHDAAPAQLHTLSLHDALPIWGELATLDKQLGESRQALDAATKQLDNLKQSQAVTTAALKWEGQLKGMSAAQVRSEEHTSELQSLTNLVCRLLLEKKKTTHQPH